MKLELINRLVIAWMLICLPAKAQQMLRAGNSSELASAASEAAGACIATIESRGMLQPGASGTALYLGCRAEVRHNLIKDDQDPKYVDFPILDSIGKKREELPELGIPFLLLGKMENQKFNLRKIAAPTIANIKIVLDVFEKRGMKVSPVSEEELNALLASPPASSEQAEANATLRSTKPVGGIQDASATYTAVDNSRLGSGLASWIIGILMGVVGIGLLRLWAKNRT